MTPTTKTNPLFLEQDLDTRACVNKYKNFYTNPAIIQLSKWPRWSISHPIEKAPMSMYGLSFNPPMEYFASFRKPRDMWSLTKLLMCFPTASNVAFYLESKDCNLIIIDVESTASEKIRRDVLSLPWLYAERSLSGQGLHVIVERPNALLKKYPATNKPKIQHPNCQWEVLLSHWVTFTRSAITKEACENIGIHVGSKTIEQVLEPLFSNTRSAITQDINLIDENEVLNLDTYDQIIEGVFPPKEREYRNLLTYHHNNRSSADFAFGIKCARTILRELKNKGITWTPSQVATASIIMMENQLRDTTLWRDKYDEKRPLNDKCGTYLQVTVMKAVASLLDDSGNWKPPPSGIGTKD